MLLRLCCSVFSVTLFIATAAGAQSSHSIVGGPSDTAFVLNRAGSSRRTSCTTHREIVSSAATWNATG